MRRAALALGALLGVACAREAPKGEAQAERAGTGSAPSAGALTATSAASVAVSPAVSAAPGAASAGASAPDQPLEGGAAPLDGVIGLGLTGAGPGNGTAGFALGAGSREEREARVYSLLAGERPAGGLPIRAGLAKEDVWVREGPPPGQRPPRVRVVRARTGGPGALSVPVVQRIARQHFGRFRMCYEQALRTDAKAHGAVTVRFVIGKDGTVSSVNGTGALPAGATQCVARAFYGMTFPAPEGGQLSTAIVDFSFEP